MSPCSAFGRCEGEKSDIASPLDCGRQQPLMAGAVSGNAARGHFSPFGHKLAQDLRVLIVNFKLFVGAEAADSTSKHGPSPGRSFVILCSLAIESWRWSFWYHIYELHLTS